MADYPHCEGCPLEGLTRPCDTTGSRNARFLVVTDTPSIASAASGRLLSKSAMQMLAKNLQAEGFKSEDFCFTPQIRCAHDSDLYTSKQKRAIQSYCSNYVVDEIKRLKPKVIIPLGADASKQVFGRAVKITKIRGIPERDFKYKTIILPFITPAQAVLYPQHEATIKSDCATLGRLVAFDYDIAKSASSVMGDYAYIDDLQFLIDAKPNILAFDTETTGLRWYEPNTKILTMQFCIEEGVAYTLSWDHPDNPRTPREKVRLKKQLRQLLCNPNITVVGQHLKHDAVFMAALTGIRLKIGADTLMLAVLLDENAFTKNLDDLVKRYVPRLAGYADMFNSTVDKNNMIALPLDQKFLDYSAGDADAAFSLYQALYPLVAEDPKLLNHYERVTLPGLNAFTSMELRGSLIDEEEIDKFEEEMEQELEEKYRELLRQVPKSIKAKHAEKGLKFSRKDFLLDILFYHQDGLRLTPKVFTSKTKRLSEEFKVPSTSTKDHLPFFFEDHPFVADLAEYIKNERLLSTNIKGFKTKYIRDGMVRPKYGLHVAVTGRSNSDDPNGQNAPKRGKAAKRYRRSFIAPPGYVIVAADLSQAELRIAADSANEPTMIRIYKNNGDIHKETALIALEKTIQEFMRLSEEGQESGRFKAKAINFGFLYGMWWKKFIIYARTQYGVTFSPAEAKRIREDFFRKYAGLGPWHDRVKAYARQHGYVRSYSGRIRHLPMIYSEEDFIRQEAERQAVNSPIQEFASSLGVIAVGRIDEEIDDQYLAVISFIHDAIYTYVPMEYAIWGARTLKYYMENTPIEEWFGVKMKVPIIADVEVGLNLADTFKLKGLTPYNPNRSVLSRAADKPYDISKLWNEETETGILLPPQRTPPRNGRRAIPLYERCVGIDKESDTGRIHISITRRGR